MCVETSSSKLMSCAARMGREKLHIVSQTSPLCDYYRWYVCDSAYLIAARLPLSVAVFMQPAQPS